MKNSLWCLGILLICFGCKKSSTPVAPPPDDTWNGIVVPQAPVAVSKSTTKKVFVHVTPWFETPASNNSCCNWGIHWTMNLGSTTPNTIVNGQRKIASHYYPMIGPYASGDTAVIDYELLLMKLSGIDGVFIDWPGTGTNLGQNLDLSKTEANAKVLISRLGKVGLKYSMVYEDQYVSRYTDKAAAAKVDIQYLQDHNFTDPNYELLNGKPLLLVFGPQAITSGAGWANVFSGLPQSPAFFTYMFQRNQASGQTTGEFGWVEQSNISRLNTFYSTNPGVKISAAYPGFNSFYAPGGWPGPTWSIAANGTATFNQTLDLALAQGNNYIQLITWNDYGEGTMIEPTDPATGGFGYSLLTSLQTKLGVPLTQADLETVAKFYGLRTANAGNAAVLNKLNQVYYYIVSLQIAKAKQLLSTI